jgi:hypothetical protein
MKVAIYRTGASEYEAPGEAGEWRESDTYYVRVSEIVEVDFPRLPPEVTVQRELASIDSAEAELRNKFNEALSTLNTRRANLQALTHTAVA